MQSLADCLCVGAGGAMGAIIRYLLGLCPVRLLAGFPLTTLAINVMGALALGLVVAWAGKSTSFNPRLLLFLKVGLCGGFTTFSTFSYEAVVLMQNGRVAGSLAYMASSLLLGLGAIALAQLMVR